MGKFRGAKVCRYVVKEGRQLVNYGLVMKKDRLLGNDRIGYHGSFCHVRRLENLLNQQVQTDLSGLAVINMSLQRVQNKFVISMY
jgi:hypothetical protein